MGLAACPEWLATEAVFGPNMQKHEHIRKELSLFVDKGRKEGRRPEFSGEVSKTLSRRLRGLMGGDVELSYPVLGPDSFVIEALTEQAERQRKKQRTVNVEFSVETLTKNIFEGLGLSPDLARNRTRRSDVARARALVVWMWVEWMRRPQVMVAEALSKGPSTISGMIDRLRKDGLSEEEKSLLENVFKTVTENENEAYLDEHENKQAKREDSAEPKVFVLKRYR